MLWWLWLVICFPCLFVIAILRLRGWVADDAGLTRVSLRGEGGDCPLVYGMKHGEILLDAFPRLVFRGMQGVHEYYRMTLFLCKIDTAVSLRSKRKSKECVVFLGADRPVPLWRFDMRSFK